jgi:DNA-binding response OmpR family regulator
MSRNILIIDDQEDMLLILEREFRRFEGATVTTTSQYADALELVESKGIDLVISDVRIGRDSGFDLVRDITRAHPHVGVMMMTAYRSSGNRQQAADLGVITFFEKPFRVPKMLEDVRNFFEKREQPEAEEAAPAKAPGDDSGALAHFRLQDLVQLFCLNGKNVMITVARDASLAGEIYIQRGRVIHAAFAEKAGDEAFYTMMRIDRPILKVDDWAAPVPVTISTGWEHLLLQAAMTIDQIQAADESPGWSAAGQ